MCVIKLSLFLREAAAGKPAGGSRCGRGGKKRLEALFAALRPHGLRPRTWRRRPTRERQRTGHALIKNKNIFIIQKDIRQDILL